MRSLFKYFVRNHVFYLFLLLETFSLVLVINYNNYQKVRYINSANRISGVIYSSLNDVVDYFSLRKINEELARQNSGLLNQLDRLKNEMQGNTSAKVDTSLKNQGFLYMPAKVVNNTVYKPYNYLTLDKGTKDGIKEGQGVISNNKIVGVVINVSRSYSSAISLLNMRFNVSAKLKNNNPFGPLNWDGRNYRYAQFNEIPFHVSLAEGDTVVSSGYSSIFPEGLLIGAVHSFEKKEGENFYSIDVELAVDFKSLSHVQVITNMNLGEIKKLERGQQDEDLD